MSKVLIVATVISMVEWFNKDLINYLIETGDYEIDVAANLDYVSDTDEKRTNEFLIEMESKGVRFKNISFTRSPFSLKLLRNYFELKKLIKSGNYHIVHCHTPVAGMLTRLAAKSSRKNKTKVIYTAHGFHFFYGSSKSSWLVYYPIEKFLSRYTDAIITINQEDYKVAGTFNAKENYYIPGVGVDLAQFELNKQIGMDKRDNLDIPQDATVILHIAELNKNKNQDTLLAAFASMEERNKCYLVLCGKGDLEEHYKKMSKELDIDKKVIFAGFRNDIPEILSMADIFVFPSFREGLPVSVIEAMASGLPVIASNIRGISDLIDSGKGGYLIEPDNIKLWTSKLKELIDNNQLRNEFGKHNIEKSKKYSRELVIGKIHQIYKDILKN